jgi:hypothetical protein
MKKALLILVISLLSVPAMAQNAEVAPPATSGDGTVRQGPLFLGGFVDKIKQSFGRKTADPVLSAQPTVNAPPVAQATTSQVMMAKAQREAYASAVQNRNRQIAAAISAAADRDVAMMAQEIAQEKAMRAAQAAGLAVPANMAAPAAQTAPVRVIDGTQKPIQGNKPIFNNYR